MTWLSAWPSPDICSRAVAGIAAEALKQMLDRELPLKERQHIRDKLQTCPETRVLHRPADPPFRRPDLCRVLPGSRQSPHNRPGHAISDAADNAITQRFLPSIVEVTAHLEPTGINDERLNDRVASARIPQ
jgi:divalent metal cation (Fe/Co/Zn/Cd) transporter